MTNKKAGLCEDTRFLYSKIFYAYAFFICRNKSF